ncbi:hypothetical protein ADL04_26545 [Streptomyces sp. NRRL B-3648]|nr:hypothetical protein ADL04_26545 [Streptomyces sp. NRRL B-3648]
MAPGDAALGEGGADAGRGVERGDAAAARAQAFGEGALRYQLQFQLAGEVLAGELLVLTDIGGRDTGDASGAERDAQAMAVGAAIVGDHPQRARSLYVQGRQEGARDAAQAEAADGQGGTLTDVGTADPHGAGHGAGGFEGRGGDVRRRRARAQ